MYIGKKEIAKMIVNTIACLIERKKGSYLIKVQKNTIVNGHLSVPMGYRFVIK